MPNTFTLPSSAIEWTTEWTTVNIGVDYGCEGSVIRKFIKDHYEQWNVKNWVELAIKSFSKKYKDTPFFIDYIPKDDLVDLVVLPFIFKEIKAEDSYNFIGHSKQGRVYAAMIFTGLERFDFYSAFFSSGGNKFFFGGEFEADKVDEGEWYDVKRLEITSLNFMDRLGGSYEIDWHPEGHPLVESFELIEFGYRNILDDSMRTVFRV